MLKMIISLIAILTTNHIIGRENSIPWNFGIDKNWFKSHTLGKPIIMGRKTFESIKKKPLIGRLNIVLSNQFLLNSWDNMYITNTPEKALSLVKHVNEVMIVGGGSVYDLFLPKATRMYLTIIDYIYKYGDVRFPRYIQNEWHTVVDIYKLRTINKKDYNLRFKILERF